MDFRKAKTVSLKTSPDFSEKWLQSRLAEDPSLLGLGDLEVKDLERRQPHAGRLDMLLSDPETHTRYEVEIQLGATDESHIIRTIEYWDVERNRYPQYEHIAVIVAEDITSRFANVIGLFNKSIPLIAIEMRALEVEGYLTLSATRVLDITSLGTDEEDDPGQATDRAYWILRGSESSVRVADELLDVVNSVTPGMTLKYNKHYVGLARDGIADNFVIFFPRHQHLIASYRIPQSEDVTAMIDESGIERLEYQRRTGRYRMRLTHSDILSHRDLLLELTKRSNGTAMSKDE